MGYVKTQLENWGVKVERVQMKKIDLVDQNMIRAMAKEAEAYRDRKAAIIRAEGEYEVPLLHHSVERLFYPPYYCN